MEREDQDDELLENDVERHDVDPGVDDAGDVDDEDVEREAVTSADDTGLVAQERAFNQVPRQG